MPKKKAKGKAKKAVKAKKTEKEAVAGNAAEQSTVIHQESLEAQDAALKIGAETQDVDDDDASFGGSHQTCCCREERIESGGEDGR